MDEDREDLRIAIIELGLDWLLPRLDGQEQPDSEDCVEREWAAIGRGLAGGLIETSQAIHMLGSLGLIRKTNGPEPSSEPEVTYLEIARDRPLVPGPRFIVEYSWGQGYLCAPLGVASRWDTGVLSSERP